MTNTATPTREHDNSQPASTLPKSAAPAPQPAAPKTVTRPDVARALRAAGLRQIVIGAVLAVIGIVVTVVTYRHAASSSSGGTYLVAWGPVVFGAVSMVRGFRNLVRGATLR
jgi:uncharacterized membrane protein